MQTNTQELDDTCKTGKMKRQTSAVKSKFKSLCNVRIDYQYNKNVDSFVKKKMLIPVITEFSYSYQKCRLQVSCRVVNAQKQAHQQPSNYQEEELLCVAF